MNVKHQDYKLDQKEFRKEFSVTAFAAAQLWSCYKNLIKLKELKDVELYKTREEIGEA